MLYRAAKVICTSILVLMRRWRVQGAHHLPPAGGVVVIANHISYWDPVVVGCALSRKVHFMARAGLFKVPVLGWIITKLGAFPVHRAASDPAAVRRSMQLLKSGHVIGIFPEGTRSHSGEMLEPHLGATMLALRVGVPVVPVGISGTKGIWGRVFISIGAPLEFTDLYRKKIKKDQLEQVSLKIIAEVKKMIKEHKLMNK